MAVLNLGAVLGLGLPILALHLFSVTLTIRFEPIREAAWRRSAPNAAGRIAPMRSRITTSEPNAPPRRSPS